MRELRDEVIIDAVLHGPQNDHRSRIVNCKESPELMGSPGQLQGAPEPRQRDAPCSLGRSNSATCQLTFLPRHRFI